MPGNEKHTGPENTNKIQKKYENGHFWAILAFLLYFRGPTWGGEFRMFFAFFSCFPALRGFFELYTNKKRAAQSTLIVFALLTCFCLFSAVFALLRSFRTSWAVCF